MTRARGASSGVVVLAETHRLDYPAPRSISTGPSAVSRSAVRIRIWLGGIAAAGILSLVAVALRSAPSAPDLAFTTITGESMRLSDFQGHPVLVTFWASDCGPCIAEIPTLDRLYRDYSEDGFHLIAIAMHYDLPSRVVALVQAAHVAYPVVLDPAAEIAGAFGGVPGVPMAFLIAPDGTIRDRISGAIDFAAVREKIRNWLGEP